MHTVLVTFGYIFFGFACVPVLVAAYETRFGYQDTDERVGRLLMCMTAFVIFIGIGSTFLRFA